ncbi:MAG: PepSY domain-containing protein [Methylobacterium sp.]|nr:PepSY domain-containing protein [Methylobacterium sp.]
MHAFRSTILLASVIGLVIPVAASPRCKAPLEKWQPREVLEEKLRNDGWKVRRIKTDDGCYKVEATRADGARVKATFEPDTLTLIREKMRDD